MFLILTFYLFLIFLTLLPLCHTLKTVLLRTLFLVSQKYWPPPPYLRDVIYVLPILRFIDGIIVIDRRFLLYDLRLSAGAGHGRAEEDVDDQHDAEEDGKGDTEPHQPVAIVAAPVVSGAVDSSSWKLRINKFYMCVCGGGEGIGLHPPQPLNRNLFKRWSIKLSVS